MRNPFKRDPDPFAASRYGEMFRSSRTRERKHMRHKWQWYLAATVIVIVAAAGWATWRYLKAQGIIHVGVEGTEEEPPGKPFNVLLVGSDNRGDLTAEEQDELGAHAVEGSRADTLIVGHVDPATNRVIMVQFPRDLWVPIAGTGRDGKINEALMYGRAALVKTVEDLTGIPINRYVEVNIAGFRDVVDAIGGVDVCVAQTVPFDPNTGFSVTKPGTITFDGDLALRFVRSRKAFERGDFDRIANQQKFLAAAIEKMTSVGTLIQPQRILKLIDIAEKNLRTNVNLNKIKPTLDRFRNFDPAKYEAYVAPHFGTDLITFDSGGQASIVRPDLQRIKLLGEAIAANESPAEADGVPSIDPKTVRVGVYNGVDLFRPYASEAARALIDASGGSDAGFQDVEVANAPHFRFKTNQIWYEAAAAEQAKLVAAMVPGAELLERATPQGVDVAVIVGKKTFRTQPLLQILPIPLPKPGAEPKVCEQEGETGDPDG
ncbi:MAG TPA: LCP family protein [Actinomycetota bacterium]|nr:LCP family protein [Actinomycetota bacterium]